MICKKCGKDRSLDQFHVDKKVANGHKRICKKCDNEAYKEYYKLNAEAIKRRTRERYRRNK